jgi:hypothetical protein
VQNRFPATHLGEELLRIKRRFDSLPHMERLKEHQNS